MKFRSESLREIEIKTVRIDKYITDTLSETDIIRENIGKLLLFLSLTLF